MLSWWRNFSSSCVFRRWLAGLMSAVCIMATARSPKPKHGPSLWSECCKTGYEVPSLKYFCECVLWTLYSSLRTGYMYCWKPGSLFNMWSMNCGRKSSPEPKFIQQDLKPLSHLIRLWASFGTNFLSPCATQWYESFSYSTWSYPEAPASLSPYVLWCIEPVVMRHTYNVWNGYQQHHGLLLFHHGG